MCVECSESTECVECTECSHPGMSCKLWVQRVKQDFKKGSKKGAKGKKDSKRVQTYFSQVNKT